MKKKMPLGFETPSMRIQEEYKEILEQIMGKKADWEKILTDCNESCKFAFDSANDIIKSSESKEISHEGLMELEHRVLAASQCITQLIVARIGKELAECDVRISEVEKELKELRRGIK